MHKFQKQGGAGSEPERNGREWSRVEREICSAASEHACGLQTAAGEGHRRSLLSCSPLGWGRLGRSVGDENSKICGNFWLRPKGRRPRPPKFRKEFVETLAGAKVRLMKSGYAWAGQIVCLGFYSKPKGEPVSGERYNASPSPGVHVHATRVWLSTCAVRGPTPNISSQSPAKHTFALHPRCRPDHLGVRSFK